MRKHGKVVPLGFRVMERFLQAGFVNKEIIIKAAKETKNIITVEDHSIIGGLGSSVCEELSEEYPTKVYRMGINDTFGKSGKAEELLKYFKIDSEAIYNKIKEIL